MSDYLVEINGVPLDTVVTNFTLICITAPIMGAILSGFIGEWIGGYTSVYALPICISFAFVVVFSQAPICFTNNSTLIFFLIWA